MHIFPLKIQLPYLKMIDKYGSKRSTISVQTITLLSTFHVRHHSTEGHVFLCSFPRQFLNKQIRNLYPPPMLFHFKQPYIKQWHFLNISMSGPVFFSFPVNIRSGKSFLFSIFLSAMGSSFFYHSPVVSMEMQTSLQCSFGQLIWCTSAIFANYLSQSLLPLLLSNS